MRNPWSNTHDSRDARVVVPSLIMQPRVAKVKMHSRVFGRMPVGRRDISSQIIVQFDNHFAVEVARSLAYLIMNI